MKWTVLGWRAFYADYAVLNCIATPYEVLPRVGLVGVIEYSTPPYRRKIHGGDWYWMEEGKWLMVPTGEWNTWQPKPVEHAIQSTSRLPENEYNAIFAAMVEAKEIPRCL